MQHPCRKKKKVLAYHNPLSNDCLKSLAVPLSLYKIRQGEVILPIRQAWTLPSKWTNSPMTSSAELSVHHYISFVQKLQASIQTGRVGHARWGQKKPASKCYATQSLEHQVELQEHCRSLHSEGQLGMDRVYRVTSLRSRCGHHVSASVFAKCTQMHRAHVLFTRLAPANNLKTIHLSGIPEAWKNDWFAGVVGRGKK